MLSGNFILLVLLAVLASVALFVELQASVAETYLGVRRQAVPEGSIGEPQQVVKVVYLPIDHKNEIFLSSLVNSIDKNVTDPLAGNVSQILWKTVKHCARYYFQIGARARAARSRIAEPVSPREPVTVADKLMRTTTFPSLKAALTDRKILDIVESCRQCDANMSAQHRDVHSPLLQADGEGMKKHCVSHVRDLVNNPGKVVQDMCVFSHDCKDKDGSKKNSGRGGRSRLPSTKSKRTNAK